ncbi:MAG: hemagglutinin, partial [Actinomycetes bacterium]
MRFPARSSRGLRWLAVASLTIPLALFSTSSAQAADGPFNIDGTIPDSGLPASANLPDDFGSVKELGPLNSSTTKIGVIHNDAVPTLGLTNPNAQVDLRQAWVSTAKDSAAPNHDWLYFGWERDSNSGSGFIAYEFMQNAAPVGCAYDTADDATLIANCNPWANRKAGDFMILWDQQGGSKDLYLRTWSGTGANLTLGAPTLLNSTVSQAQYSADGFRGEAAVDLTATIFGGSTACKTFANTIPSTVTGNSDTADYKDTILQTAPPITNCTSSTVTTPKTAAGGDIPAAGLSIGNGVVGVKDSAVVSLTGGTATPAGSVAFSLCKVDSPGLCTTGGTTVGSTNLTGTAYPATVVSPTAYVTSAGRYCWRAVFSGDSANGIPSSSDSSATECFTVNPVTPTLSTTASAGVNLGGSVSDRAALSGLATQPANPVINLTGASGAAAGGTITFKLYGPNDCTTVAYTSPTVSVNGNGNYDTPNPQFVPTAAGTYHWVAQYSGNSPNNMGTTHNAACGD